MSDPACQTSPPSVWIVVLNWNGLADTLACIESVRALRHPATLVVVDNGSTDGSASALREAAAKGTFRLLETARNLGYAGGNNVGIRHALENGADFVLVLNNDTRVDPTLLDELVAASARYPDAGCFGAWIYYMHEPERLWFTRSEWDPAGGAFTAEGKGRLARELPGDPVATQYVCGAALMFRADVAREIGLFEEKFFLVYEDSDWCFRARRAGYRCMAIPSARVWHKVGTSFGSEASPLRTYFSTRNRLLWGERNLARPESLRMTWGALSRLLPVPALDRSAKQPLLRALLWSAHGFVRECRRRLRDPQEVARRRGVLDYLFRRFGDCPPSIRTIAGEWARERRSRTPRGASA